MDIKNIYELIQRMNQDNVKDLYVVVNGSVTTATVMDLIDDTEKLLGTPPDYQTSRKIDMKNQEELSAFYAGKKRRKGGRYA
jgi:hypothetical protein